jgi:hypothetical protein
MRWQIKPHNALYLFTISNNTIRIVDPNELGVFMVTELVIKLFIILS